MIAPKGAAVKFSMRNTSNGTGSKRPLRSDAEVQVNMCACSSRTFARVDALMDRLEVALDKANGARLFMDALRG